MDAFSPPAGKLRPHKKEVSFPLAISGFALLKHSFKAWQTSFLALVPLAGGVDGVVVRTPMRLCPMQK
jgi:hypothetical protein